MPWRAGRGSSRSRSGPRSPRGSGRRVQHALNGLFQPLALALIYGLVHYGGTPEEPQLALDLATFLSFNAAFGQLTAAVISLTIAATTAVSILPLLERVRPILAARPENADGGGDPGDLRGGIEFANVTFRYGSHQPDAVDDVSFRIDAGEYVAFVGPSGCGKSTLFRLLLGFEQPTSGSVFLDGHDLSGLDWVAVRRCMGVVPQNGQLVAGNIYENIAGMSPLGAEGAWEAVRAAALDEDIRAMPMRMRTVVTSHGSGLSAGQKQRLLIARALARRPRILLLDEATSALDNRAQAAVQASIRKLSATRVVIAHRLSSIRDVDRIFVMDRGRIVRERPLRRSDAARRPLRRTVPSPARPVVECWGARLPVWISSRTTSERASCLGGETDGGTDDGLGSRVRGGRRTGEVGRPGGGARTRRARAS